MKPTRSFAFVAFILFLISTKAQNSVHSTINELSVSYKAVPLTATSNTALPMFRGIPQAVITLKPSSSVTKVYLKISDNTTNALIYQVNYLINSNIITDANGNKLFENNNGTIFISSGTDLALRPYKYEITTEAKPGELSTVFSAIK